MPIARFQMPDGRIARFEVAEGTTPEQAQQQIAASMTPEAFAAIKADGQAVKPVAQFTPSGEKDLSYGNPDMQQAHPLVRFAKGAAAPVLGAAQLGLNAVGAGGPINSRLAETEAMTQRGRAEGGSTGIDWWGAGGQVASPAYLAATKLLTATSVPGRAAQGAAFGGAAGAAEPVTGGDYWSQKAAQTAGGAVVGGVIPPAFDAAVAAAKGVRNVVQPFMGEAGADKSAGRLLNSAVGTRREAIIKALKDAEESATSGQSAVGANSAEFQALQQIAAQRDPSKYFGAGGIEGQQNQARLAAVRSVGGNEKTLQTAIENRAERAREAYGQVANDLINPASDVAIMEGAIAGREAAKAEALRDWGKFATTAAQQDTLANGGVVSRTAGGSGNVSPSAYPVSGMPRVPARLTDNADRIPEALAAAADSMGIAAYRQKQADFLKNAMESLKETVGLDNRGLSRFLDRPSVQAAVKDAMLSAQETGAYFPAAPGERFSVANLQRIKESLDAGIVASKQSAANGKRPDLSPKELEGTREAFISWLSNKSPGWRDARQQYAADSGPINRMEIGQYLEKKLVPALGQDVEGAKQAAATFSQALRDAPGTIKRATGNPRFEHLSEVLTEKELATLMKVREGLATDAASQALGRAGMPSALRKVNMSMPEMAPTGMFNPKISFARGVYNRVTGNATEKVLDDLAKRMDNPKEVARIMENASSGERRSIADLLEKINAVRATSQAR
jgi:hypothetical protein